MDDSFHVKNIFVPQQPPYIFYISDIDTLRLDGHSYPRYKYYRDSIPHDTVLHPPLTFIKHIGGWFGIRYVAHTKPNLNGPFLQSDEFFGLRCFSSENKFYKFPYDFGWWKSDYPCDTTYLEHFIYNNIQSEATSENIDIQIFPNPTQNTIRVDWPGNSDAPFKLVDALGHMAMEGVLRRKPPSLDLHTLSKGTYFLLLQSPGNQTLGTKVVVR
jgi:hypothetical protein